MFVADGSDGRSKEMHHSNFPPNGSVRFSVFERFGAVGKKVQDCM